MKVFLYMIAQLFVSSITCFIIVLGLNQINSLNLPQILTWVFTVITLMSWNYIMTLFTYYDRKI